MPFGSFVVGWNEQWLLGVDGFEDDGSELDSNETVDYRRMQTSVLVLPVAQNHEYVWVYSSRQRAVICFETRIRLVCQHTNKYCALWGELPKWCRYFNGKHRQSSSSMRGCAQP